MSFKNIKLISVDADSNRPYRSATNLADYIPVLTAQCQYVLAMTCYDRLTKAIQEQKSFDVADTYWAALGTPSYAASPLVECDNTAFNDASDWSDVDATAGKICVKISLNTEALLTDISGLASKEYVLQTWCISTDTGEPYLVMSTPVLVKNVAVEVS